MFHLTVRATEPDLELELEGAGFQTGKIMLFSMDMSPGTVFGISVLLSQTALLAKVLVEYIRVKNSRKLTIELPRGGRIEAQNLSSEELKEVLEQATEIHVHD